MNKSILIEYKNIPETVKEQFLTENIINFDYSNRDEEIKSLDEYISTTIIEQLKDKKFDVIYIKDNLSSNYLELYGLRVAYHIRLSQKLDNQIYVPIIILSDLDGYTLNKLEPMARILFTKNIFLKPNNLETIVNFNNIIEPLSQTEYENKFLNLITVKAPENSSSHSITNEWAIDQWAKKLSISTDATEINHNKIAFMLHIKYLRAKYNLYDTSASSITKKNVFGKVLLIDDKTNEGWEDIIAEFLVQHYDNVQFQVLENINKDTNIEKLKKLVKQQIDIADSPDLILLDIRLLAEEKETINKISGLEILKHIKNINPSIQVIIFSASKNSKILDTLHENGILGYVQKDSPTDRYEASKNSFKKLDKLIEFGLSKKYLKDIYRTQENILSMSLLSTKMSKNEKLGELKTTVVFTFEILNSNIPNPFLYAMYSIFKCIEIINDLFIEEKYSKGIKQAYWINTTNLISKIDENNFPKPVQYTTYNKSVENKIRAILHEKLNLTDYKMHEQIKMIVCNRNNSMHAKKENEEDKCKSLLIEELKQEHIITWFSMLYKIVEKMDKI